MSSPASRALPVLAGAFLIQLLSGFGFIAFSLLAPNLSSITGLNERDFGLAITFFFVGTAITSPITGALVRRLGGAWTATLSQLFMVAGLLIILGGTWPLTMLAALIFGLAYGPLGPIGMTAVTQSTPPARRGLFLSLRHSAQPLAGAIAGRLLPPLMIFAGWQAGVLSVAGAVFFGALFTLLQPSLFNLDVRPPPTLGHANVRQGSWFGNHLAALVSRFVVPRGLGLLWGAGLVLAVNQIAMIVFAYLYLLEVIGLTPISAGIFVSNIQIAGIIGRPLLGWVCDKTGHSQYVLAVLAVMGVLTIITLLQFASKDMSPIYFFVLAIACGLSGHTWNSVFTTAMSYKVEPGRLVEMNGRAFSFLSLGWMSGGPLFWILIEYSGGYQLPFIIVLVANSVAAIALFSAKKH